MTTTNMQLVLATVSQTLGPEWAQLINAAFELVDAHDHSSGKGIKVTPSGININSTLDFQNNKAASISAAGLQSLSAADTAQTGTLQRIGTNLWWINSGGSAVQLTSGASVVSTGSGALSVDVPASYPYTVTTGDSETVLIIDTTSARTINLPAAVNAMYVILKDGDGSAQTNNITVAPDGTDLIDGSNSDYIIDYNNASVGLISDGVSKWYII